MARRTFILPRALPRDRAICDIVDTLEDLPMDLGFRLEIHEHKSTRTDAQNRTLWWAYDNILKLGGESMGGWTRDDLHEFFLCLHFGAQTRTIFGKKRQVPVRRSSRLSKLEFMQFFDHIYRFMAEHGVVLPDPDPELSTFRERDEVAA